VTSELDRETREWLRSATAAEPRLSGAHRARLKAGVLGKVAAGVALPATVAAKSALTWVVVGAGVGALAVGTVQLVRSPNEPQGTPTVAAARNVPSAARPPHLPTEPTLSQPVASAFATPAATTTAPPARSLARAQPGATSAPRNGASNPAMAAPSSGPSVALPNADLRAELDLMNALQAALRDGAAERADRLIREHAARFPRGQLLLERTAAEVFAACQRGDRARAQRAAQQFLASDSSSALAARVRASCATDAAAAADTNSARP